MVNNGYISFITEALGGFDEDGNPIETTDENSVYFPCNIAVVTRDYKIYTEGQYKQAKYKIIVDNFHFSLFDLPSLIKIQLKDSKNVDLGIFQVQNKEYLNLTQKLKIVV